MIKTTIRTFLETTRALLKDRTALAIFAGFYALLLATLYGFIAAREASIWQVLLTLFFLVLVPAEFFIMQAAVVNQARGGKLQWSSVLRDSCKLAVSTIPVIVVGYAIFVLLNRWQTHFPAPQLLPRPITPGPAKTPPLHRPTLLFATARSLFFAVLLPLMMIHFWIETASHDTRSLIGGGARSVLKRTGQVVARAFAFRSVLTYALGLIIFGVIPYALLFVHRPIQGNKTDFAVFIIRQTLVFGLTLFGWIVTIGALARLPGRDRDVANTKTEEKPLELAQEPTN